MREIYGIIFDMDGVLFDTQEVHHFAQRNALKDYGLLDAFLAREQELLGLPTRKKIEALTNDEDLIESIIQTKNDLAREALKKACAPNVQILGMMSALSMMGYRMTIASNASRPTVEAALKHSGLEGFFQHFGYFTSTEALRPKPHPEVYDRARERLGLQPEEVIAFDDLEVGVQSARDAGIVAYQVLRGPDQMSLSYVYDCIRVARSGKSVL